MRITIPAGVHVLIAADPVAGPENHRRAIATASLYGAEAGVQIVPPWLVLIHGERDTLAPLLDSPAVRKTWPIHAAPSRITVEVGAFNWRAEDFRPAFVVGTFPHDWIHPSYVEHFGAWLETDSGATITTEQGDDIAAAIVDTPSKPRPSRAAGKDAA
jgi:hypothetical protein